MTALEQSVDLADEVRAAVSRAREQLLEQQTADGWW